VFSQTRLTAYCPPASTLYRATLAAVINNACLLTQLGRLSEVRWLQYRGGAGVQIGLPDTGVQLSRFDARPDGWCPTGSVDIAAGGSGRVGTHNVGGYTRVPQVPGGPGILDLPQPQRTK